MAVELMSVHGLWPIARRIPWLVGLVARRYFTEERLAGLVYVDMFPRNESTRLDLAAIASFQVHLQLINLSPFELELQQANFHLWCGGVKLDAIVLKKERISSGASKSLFLSGPINDAQANQIALMHRGNTTSLGGNIEFKCSARSFAKQILQLSHIQAIVINEEQRVPQAK
jgi:hypothetical protein